MFYLIAPTAKNLQTYMKWTCSVDQDKVFLGDLVDRDNCMYVEILPGQTLLIPGGWIHSVNTPEDSQVFGGNFLLYPCVLRQLQVHAIELRTQVGKQYRFPCFQQMCCYALCDLLPRVLVDFPIPDAPQDPQDQACQMYICLSVRMSCTRMFGRIVACL